MALTINSGHAKAWTAAAGTVLNLLVLLAQNASAFLPPQWTAIISGIIGVLTVLGVYHIPNRTISAPPATGSTPWPAS